MLNFKKITAAAVCCVLYSFLRQDAAMIRQEVQKRKRQ